MTNNIRGGPRPSMSVQRAREIMGANVFGVEEGLQHMNVKFRRLELAMFTAVPATDAELEEAKETHILIAIPSISIVTMRERVTKEYRTNNVWYLTKTFAARLGLPGWRLVCKTAVPNSILHFWTKQPGFLRASDKVPSARVLCYAMAGRHLQVGEKLFSDGLFSGVRISWDGWVRTSDVADGLHVNVSFDADSIGIGSWLGPPDTTPSVRPLPVRPADRDPLY